MKKGFTLIELLIVISIIGILAVALLPNILSAPATARDAGRKATLNTVLSALEQYKAANGAYPTGAGCLPTSLNSFFKGTSAPFGAPIAVTTDAALGCTAGVTVGDNAKVAYCPLTADGAGYSYIVAIRMENKMTGAATPNNVLKPLASGTDAPGTGIACPTAYTAATVNAVETDASFWYYIVQ